MNRVSFVEHIEESSVGGLEKFFMKSRLGIEHEAFKDFRAARRKYE